MAQKKAPASTAGNKRICIIGAGISGLALANFLLRFREKEKDIDIHIFEKEITAGGNCCTYDVQLDNANVSKNRWADMGVNDFNAATYGYLNAMMDDAGYTGCPKLEDTEAYGNTDGTICYTNEKDGRYNTTMPAQIVTDNKKFQAEAWPDSLLPKYFYYTLSDYVKEKKYSQEFINNNLYPRVNGMYFCAGSPAEMPLRMVMSYYGLQEGYGSGAKPDRRYFKGGTSEWIKTLMARNKALNNNKELVFPGAGDNIKVAFNGGKAYVKIGGSPQQYDAVIMAMPADEAIKCFDDISKVPQEIIDTLGQFQYVSDEVVVHTDSRSLQPAVNSARTYNIHIYDSKNYNYGPYTITYVGNRHQNDAENPKYKNDCQNPQFLISVNPVVQPAANSVLLRADNKEAAKKVFRHQKLTLNTFRSQQMVYDMQGKYGVYFCNGYAYGAGLHEECIIYSLNIAEQVLRRTPSQQFHFDFSKKPKQFAPDYLINAHKKNKKIKL